MFATGSKKMLNMLILDILEQYSDDDHHLTQQDIIRHLQAQYGMECDRRSVKNNIDSLKELGYDIVTNNKGAFLAERKDAKRKPVSLVTDLKNGFFLPKHMAEHIYMLDGRTVHVCMVAKKHLMNELTYWFGKDFKIRKEFEDEMLIDVNCNKAAMRFWALQYGHYVEVLEPAELREEIRERAQFMLGHFNLEGWDWFEEPDWNLAEVWLVEAIKNGLSGEELATAQEDLEKLRDQRERDWNWQRARKDRPKYFKCFGRIYKRQ